MKTKLFEVRDRATCIIVMATKIAPEQYVNYDKYEREYKLLRRSGFDPKNEKPFIMLTYVENNSRTEYLPEAWGDRTLQTVHRYIRNTFDELTQDDVLDVEYILGEKHTIKETEVR